MRVRWLVLPPRLSPSHPPSPRPAHPGKTIAEKIDAEGIEAALEKDVRSRIDATLEPFRPLFTPPLGQAGEAGNVTPKGPI